MSGLQPVCRNSLALLAAGLLLGLCGCVNYSDIGSEQQLLNPGQLSHVRSLSADHGSWPTRNWWQTFGDAQLNLLIEEALANSPALDKAASRVALASASLERVSSALLPAVFFSTSVTGQHYSENGLVPAPIGGSFRRSGDLGLNAQYSLDFWGRNRAAVAASRSRLAASEAEAASSRLLLASAVAHRYFELAQAQTMAVIAEHALAQRQQIVALTRQRVDAGLDNQVELQQAQTQLPLTRAVIAQVGENVVNIQHSLAVLLGAGPDHLLDLHARLPDSIDGGFSLPADLPVGLLGHRPDMVAARWQVEATLSDTDARKAVFYPDINLTAFAGFSSIGLDQLVNNGSAEYGITPALSLPLFDGNRLRASLKADFAAYDGAVANYNRALLEALRDVASQINSYRALQPQMQELRLALEAARTARQLALQRYQSGLGNYLTVLNTEATVIQQEIYFSQLQQRALSTRVELARALGGGYPTEDTPPLPASPLSASTAATTDLTALQAATGEHP